MTTGAWPHAFPPLSNCDGAGAAICFVEMNKPADPDDLLAQIRAMPLADRHRVTAELLDDLDEDLVEPPALLDELRRRAEEALAHPERGVSLEDSIAQARAAVAKVRARKA